MLIKFLYCMKSIMLFPTRLNDGTLWQKTFSTKTKLIYQEPNSLKN